MCQDRSGWYRQTCRFEIAHRFGDAEQEDCAASAWLQHRELAVSAAGVCAGSIPVAVELGASGLVGLLFFGCPHRTSADVGVT